MSAITRNKTMVFIGVGAMLVFNYWFAIVRPRRMACAPGELCHVDSPAMRLNRRMFWVSVAIYAIAVTVTTAAVWWVRSQP